MMKPQVPFSFVRFFLFMILGLLCASAQSAEPLWTWVKGSNNVLSETIYRDNGVYGTRGVPAPANTPGARKLMTTWTGKDGRFWLFGGLAGPSRGDSLNNFNDLWSYAPATGNWTWIKGSNTTNQDGVYGTQDVADPANTPGAREGAAAWTDQAGRLWLFGGYREYIDSGSRAIEYYNDLWRFDPATGNWTWVKGSNKINRGDVYGTKGVEDPANTPGARYRCVAWTGKDGRLWLFGGQVYSIAIGYCHNDLWRFDPATGNWTWIKGSNSANQNGIYGVQGSPDPANTPGAREGATGWTDKWGGFWLFGGRGLPYNGHFIDAAALNDLWRFDPVTENWTWVKGSNIKVQPGAYGTRSVGAPANTPGAREGAAGWADRYGRLWLYGGYGYAQNPLKWGDLNDLWRFDIISSTWTWCKGSSDTLDALGVYGTKGTAAPDNNPSGRENAAATWTDTRGRLWLFGGYGNGYVDSYGGKVFGMFNDLWMLTVPPNAVAGAAWRGLE